MGCTVQKGPAGGGSDPPEHSRGREVKRGEIALRDEKRDAADGERSRGGVGVTNREKEGELNPEHPDGVEELVPAVFLVAKGGEDVFPQDEGFESKQENARARETERREVDRVERHRLHEVLRGDAHGTPKDAGGGSEKNADQRAREHRKTSGKQGGECKKREQCRALSRGSYEKEV